VAILYLGGVAELIAFAVALYVGGTLRRTGALMALGPCLTIVSLVANYVSARPISEPANCSDCGDHLGRWVDVSAIFVVVGGNAVAWFVGTIFGSTFGAVLRRRRSD
jgi:hypothetical protein